MKKVIALIACLCLLLPMAVAAAGDTLTVSEAIAMGLANEHNVYTTDKYYVTAVIKEVYSSTYGNMRVVAEGDDANVLTIYGTFSADGELRYDAMEVKPVAGDTVKLYGIIGQYNGTPQMKNAWIVEHIPGVGVEAPEVELVEAPVANTAYKFGMIQGAVSETDVYYLTGNMDGYYLGTTTNANDAIDVTLEETAGGYHLSAMVDGAKKYINMVVSGTHVNGAYEDAASTVYTYNAEKKTIVANVDGADYWFGTRNDKTYTTVGPCKVEYDGFYSQFYAIKKVEEPSTAPSESTSPSENTTAATPEATTKGTDVAEKTDPMGENNTAIVLALAVMALACAGVVASKKRA